MTTSVELAKRGGGGIDVSLFWDRRSGRVWVEVFHLATGRCFKLRARRDNALDVYYHPFASDGRRWRLDDLPAAAPS